MARQEKSLEELYEGLVIDEEDEGGIIVANTEVVQQKQTYVLIGRFLTEKNINFHAMQNVMATLWRPREGMEVHDIGGMRYSFVFFHKMDMQKAIEGGPWSFEQATLILHQLVDGEDPNTVRLHSVATWVQVYDIPRGFLSENILRSIGVSIGEFIRMDANTLDGVWKPFVRIRVMVNVEKPLKRRLKIKREGDNWSWMNFKYERLGTFCFVCGILGHSERDCSIVYANPDKIVERAYGVWLRASTKYVAKLNTGARWLRNTGADSSMWTTMDKRDAVSTVVQNGEQGKARFMEVDGVVRENHGDIGGIAVTGRDFRPVNMQVNMTDTVSDDLGEENMERDNVVCDSKRKRVEDNVEKLQEGYQDNLNVENQKNGSLNLQVAGPGVQARLGL